MIVNSRLGYVVPLNSIGDFDLPECVGCTTTDQFRRLEDIDDDLKLSLSERYFLGGLGAFQLRGFEQRTVGPRRTALSPLGAGDDTLYFPHRRNTISGPGQPRCVENDGTPLSDDACNDIDDKDIDEFENLDLTDVIGGNKMFLLNLELQFPISEDGKKILMNHYAKKR